MYLSTIIMTNTIMSTFMKHPLSMGFMLMVQTTMLCLNQSTISKTPWYMYVMFLTTVGGLMIMFMYMASIASNEKFKLSIKMMMVWTMMTMMTMMMTNIDLTMECMYKMTEMKMQSTEMSEEKSTSKFFMMNKMNITMMMMMILILTMVSVTNISSTFEGPLKKY
uniref:NADH-ubiquinone oxidoreductase chain 6 n=1 Tax=Pyrops candelaria TaxID=553985 RepID=K7N7J4_PYRCD|nr:NADH dehydrogenase subunit 6 [Pyrops candelaria]ACH42497.1 NADH dehydrogenase subunit 6 [Pyrops candelaria]QRZ60685.1 NADH dehydrogenase subunit 6 [Pyrops candelaria]